MNEEFRYKLCEENGLPCGPNLWGWNTDIKLLDRQSDDEQTYSLVLSLGRLLLKLGNEIIGPSDDLYLQFIAKKISLVLARAINRTTINNPQGKVCLDDIIKDHPWPLSTMDLDEGQPNTQWNGTGNITNVRGKPCRLTLPSILFVLALLCFRYLVPYLNPSTPFETIFWII